MRQQFLLAFAAITVALTGCTAPPHPAPAPASAIVEDAMNPLCIVLIGENITDETVAYKGQLYHVCCSSCISDFNQDPEKYVKAFKAHAAAYDAK